MKKKNGLIFGVIAILLVVTGVVVFKTVYKPAPKTIVASEATPEALPTAPASIVVDLVKSTAKANSVVLSAKGLNQNNIVSLSYELSYDSQGLIKGVSGTVKADELNGADTFSREIYLGTCSKNDCKPDLGVSKVSVVMEFTDNAGHKSQFSQDYALDGSAPSGSSSGSSAATSRED